MSAQARKKLRSQISPNYKYQTMAITYHRPAHMVVASHKSTRVSVPTVAAREVQAVLDSRIRRRTLQYFVDWVGYDESDRSWERADALLNATKAMDAFHKKNPAKPR